MKSILKLHFLMLVMLVTFISVFAQSDQEGDTWQQPAQEILDVLNAPLLPRVWTSPSGTHMIMADPIIYPPLEELGSTMHKLAGLRVNPANNYLHGQHGGKAPRIFRISDKSTIDLGIPEEAELLGVSWTADGQNYAMMVAYPDHIGLWLGKVNGETYELKGIALNDLLGTSVSWLPDQKRLLILRVPERGNPPMAPAIPKGPEIKEGDGATARSTYEARNLLVTAHDDALFEYYCTSEPVIFDTEKNSFEVLGNPGLYSNVESSPDGNYFLTERLVGLWSHEVAWWRFASEVEIWDKDGYKVKTIASLPLADAVPIQGVREGPRNIAWRATAGSTLFWLEALDGGNPVAEATHRDKMMRLDAPFKGEAAEVYRAEHRIAGMNLWRESGNEMMMVEWERMKRWIYYYLLDVETGERKLWYDRNQSDQYNNPGSPLNKMLPNGQYVMKEKDGSIYFRGNGASPQGNRPFLDLKNIESGESKRLFRCDPNRYEYFVAFAEKDDQFIFRSESSKDVPNYYLASMGKKIEAEEGEAQIAIQREAITTFKDPSPQLRQIEKRLVHYERADSVPLSFQLHLPPGYEEGTPLPTVVYAYPMEYSGAGTAGQVRGSDKRFMRIYGASHLYFLLQGYAVLDQTAMPMIGDPETTYNTFVPQLVADAEAAVKKAVEMGVADPDRIGVIGHSHGGLMVANLLAHTDLFKAGIARSGSYNKTNQPFGFQSERRSLFEARDVYIDLSPTFFADQVNEPVLIIHGADDSNPGTLTFQSEVFYEAVRGSGGTARLVLLPFEDHGYRAKESIEHVLWEQLRWFDKYLK
jgi:dipeptidyl aminopeptidase/acylaminoacyl peptidase